MFYIIFQGWRWAFYLSGIPGVLVGALILMTVREPGRNAKREKTTSDSEKEELLGAATNDGDSEQTALIKLEELVKNSLSLSIFILCLAGSIRNAC